MRATIDGIEIEGTPEEVARFVAEFRGDKSPDAPSGDRKGESADNDDGEITEQFAYRTLRRLPLSKAQKRLLITLRNAYPTWMLSSQLQTALDCTPMQIGGILGGLGRRLSATKGYRNTYCLWDWKWDVDEGEYAYRLPSAVLAALDRVGL